MKKIALITLSLFSSVLTSGQSYLPVSEIPANLMEGTDAVVRFDETEFFVESIRSSVTRKHWAVTIFNERGEAEHGRFEAYYDKLSQIKKLEGTLYDASGKEIKKLRNSDFTDIGLSGFSSEISDSRVKIAEFDKKYYPYPYTVEFSFEKRSSNMMFYPHWMPSVNERTGIEKGSFLISVPEGLSYRKLVKNLPDPSRIMKSQGKVQEVWEIKNYKKLEFENHSKYLTLPQVITAPIDFQVDDYVGKINSWADASSFYYNLNEGRDKLPAKTVLEINDLVKNEKTTEDKIKKIYSYVQAKCRYQSIQLGIGGWQSMTAMEVATKGYGDCKALSNFTVALLNVVGVKAYAAIINAGRGSLPEHPEIPRLSGFNHVIACVPVESDTIWLECTSQDDPFGYQGSFTGNRQALLVKKTGGGMVNTTSYSPEANAQIRVAKIRILENGDGLINMNTTFSGIQQDTRAHVYSTLSVQDQKDWLAKNLNLPDFRVGAVNSTLKKERVPELKEVLTLEASKLCTFSGKRMFLKPNLFESFPNSATLNENRKEDLFLSPNSYSFLDTDSLVFEIPGNFEPEYLPKEIHLTHTFGEYKTSVTREGNALIYRRRLKLKGGTYPKEVYSEWVNFIRKVNSNDKQKVVLVNRNG